LRVDILDPYPPRVGLERIAGRERVAFVSSLNDHAPWDCLVTTDVLEHVGAPIEMLRDMAGAVRMRGYLIIANNFAPVIKCHLPGNMHLRATFEAFALALGLTRVGRIQDTHAVVYRRDRKASVPADLARLGEHISRAAFPFFDTARRLAGKGWRAMREGIR
jgi:2-polyprenyl-6-hydroxyphenyl methylase/3-demethylubiquinone-9 3-methyltransferase